ncbi:hypothetical protein B0T10DRAFT_563328 [Thelonectria olida]|uniref:Uncharacterized protein n=1 Tax=Thelonectria olida TaxID=1576542 RepID=A0A9P8W0W3_9HYPO|nr:hypothetical protein B0T10DRAFT_563328 [Thelonectria olida]
MACPIEGNADVSGVGVRLSIYILCLAGRTLSYLLNQRKGEPAVKFNKAVASLLSVQGLALLCTALFETFNDRLSLFHSIVVLHLLALLGFTLVTRGTHQYNDSERHIVEHILNALTYVLFGVLSCYTWVEAPELGDNPGCNKSVKYVIFGQDIAATTEALRNGMLGASALLSSAFILASLTSILIPRRKKWFPNCRQLFRRYKEDKTAGAVSLGSYVAFAVYVIVSLELIIARNKSIVGDEEWTFGQTLSLFMLIGLVTEFAEAMGWYPIYS